MDPDATDPEIRRPDYCTQPSVTCDECSLTNYGKDCRNNPVRRGQPRRRLYRNTFTDA